MSSSLKQSSYLLRTQSSILNGKNKNDFNKLEKGKSNRLNKKNNTDRNNKNIMRRYTPKMKNKNENKEEKILKPRIDLSKVSGLTYFNKIKKEENEKNEENEKSELKEKNDFNYYECLTNKNNQEEEKNVNKINENISNLKQEFLPFKREEEEKEENKIQDINDNLNKLNEMNKYLVSNQNNKTDNITKYNDENEEQQKEKEEKYDNNNINSNEKNEELSLSDKTKKIINKYNDYMTNKNYFQDFYDDNFNQIKKNSTFNQKNFEYKYSSNDNYNNSNENKEQNGERPPHFYYQIIGNTDNNKDKNDIEVKNIYSNNNMHKNDILISNKPNDTLLLNKINSISKLNKDNTFNKLLSKTQKISSYNNPYFKTKDILPIQNVDNGPFYNKSFLKPVFELNSTNKYINDFNLFSYSRKLKNKNEYHKKIRKDFLNLNNDVVKLEKMLKIIPRHLNEKNNKIDSYFSKNLDGNKNDIITNKNNKYINYKSFGKQYNKNYFQSMDNIMPPNKLINKNNENEFDI